MKLWRLLVEGDVTKRRAAVSGLAQALIDTGIYSAEDVHLLVGQVIQAMHTEVPPSENGKEGGER